MIDLLSSSTLVNPYPIYNKMREEQPVCEIEPGGIWVLTRFDDVCEGLANHDLFTSEKKQPLFSPDWLTDECQSDLFLAIVEPPEHRSLRSAISRPFASKHLKKLKPLMANVVAELVETLQTLDNIEFLRDFAYPYVGTIVSSITKLDNLQTLDETRLWMQAVEMAAVPNLEQNKQEQIKAVVKKQKSLFSRVINEKRNNITDDIISELILADIKGVPLTTDQLVNALELLIRSGYQSTVHLLATAVIQLIRHPTIRDEITVNPERIPVFVEELLRLYSPIPMAIRHTTKDINLHGVNIPSGSEVWLSMAAANRDPRKFHNPDEYDLHRDARKDHIAFGYGHRLCMGLHLARLEMEVALVHLLPLIPTMSCPADQDLKWLKTLLVRSLEELPIRL